MVFGDVVRALVLLRVVMIPHICGALPYNCGLFFLKSILDSVDRCVMKAEGSWLSSVLV